MRQTPFNAPHPTRPAANVATDAAAPVVVLGMHRSGTSALTRALGALGYAMPADDIGAKPGNPLGHWESRRIIETNDAMFEDLSRSWQDWREVDLGSLDTEDVVAAASESLAHAFAGQDRYVLKDPRLCRLFPVYREALAKAGVTPNIVLIVRNPLEVMASLRARDGMAELDALMLWLTYNVEAELHSRGLPRAVCTFDALLSDSGAVLGRLSDQLPTLGTLSEAPLPVQADARNHDIANDQIARNALSKGLAARAFHVFAQLADSPDSPIALAAMDSLRLQLGDLRRFLVAQATAERALRDALQSRADRADIAEAKLADALRESLAEREAAEAVRNGLYSERERLVEALTDAEFAHARLEGLIATQEIALTEVNASNVEAREHLQWHRERLAVAKEALEQNARDAEALNTQHLRAQEAVATLNARVADLQNESAATAREAWERHTRDQDAIKTLNTRIAEMDAAFAIAAEQAETRHVRDHDAIQSLQARISETEERAAAEAKSASQRHARALDELRDTHQRQALATQSSLATLTALVDAARIEKAAEFGPVPANPDTDPLAHALELYANDVADLRAELARQLATTEAYLSSASWRITRPLRAATNLARHAVRAAETRVFRLLGIARPERPASLEDALRMSYSESLSGSVPSLASGRAGVLDTGFAKAAAGLADLPDDALPTLTISAVLYNSANWLHGFMESLLAQNYPLCRIALHVVDNGSTDDSAAWVEAFMAREGHRFWSTTLTRGENVGYGRGNDVALRAATTEFVFVTNVDLVLHDNTLRRAVSAAAADGPKAASWEMRQLPHEHPKYYDPVTLKTNWSTHAAVLMRRSAYIRAGGYDPNLFMYGEDAELSYRLRANGFVLRYLPTATVTHFVSLDDTGRREHQLSGSIAANLLMRERYGTRRDRIAGEGLFKWLRFRERDPARLEAMDRAASLVAQHRKAFRNKAGKRSAHVFPFHQFDYDIIRDGAAVQLHADRARQRADQTTALPLVSVVTRAHMQPGDALRAANLRNAVMSVLNQTYPNIEHIIVEDRTEGARPVVEAMQRGLPDANIRYLRSPGTGRSAAGNAGFAAARGEFLCLLDDDDMFFADHVETLMDPLALDDGRAVAAYALAWNTLSEAKGDEMIGRMHVLHDAHRREFEPGRLARENFIPIQAICFRRELFERLGGFHEDIDHLEDWNLWHRYASAGNFIFVPKVTSIYRTPFDPDLRRERQTALDHAYETVRQRNLDDLRQGARD